MHNIGRRRLLTDDMLAECLHDAIARYLVAVFSGKVLRCGEGWGCTHERNRFDRGAREDSRYAAV